jgi:hypothetical protein
MLVSIKEVEFRYDGGGLGKSYMVWYYQPCLPNEVKGVQIFGKDELDAYRKFKPFMYDIYGLTVYLC